MQGGEDIHQVEPRTEVVTATKHNTDSQIVTIPKGCVRARNGRDYFCVPGIALLRPINTDRQNQEESNGGQAIW